MAARLAASPGAGPVLPRPATIRPNLDHPRCALSYPSMSLLDSSEWPLPLRSAYNPWKVPGAGAHQLVQTSSTTGMISGRRDVSFTM